MPEEPGSSGTPLLLLFLLLSLSPLPCRADGQVAIVYPADDALVDDHPTIAGIGPPHLELRVVVQSSPGPIPRSDNSRDHPQDITTLTTTTDAQGVFAVGPLTLPATAVSRYWEVVVVPADGRETARQAFHQTAGGFGIDAPRLVSLEYDLMVTGTPLLFDIGFVGGTPPFTYTLAWPDERTETGTTSDRIVHVARRFNAGLGYDYARVDASDASGKRAWWSITTCVGMCICGQGGLLQSIEPSTFRPSPSPGTPATTITAAFGGKFPIHIRLGVRGDDRRWAYSPDGKPCTNYDAAWFETNPGMLTFTWDGWDNTLDDNPSGLPVPFSPSGHHCVIYLSLEWYCILDGPDYVQRFELPVTILPWRP